MRDLFRGYYQPTPDEIDIIWSNGITVLDANVLLSLYKVAPATSSIYLKSLEQRADKNWLPYQVAMEFHNNVHKIRSEQTAGHSKRIKEVESFRDILRKTENKSRLQESKIQTQIEDLLEKLLAELKEEQSGIKAQTHHNKPDELLTRISELFAGRVGSKPAEEDLAVLLERGKARFDRSTPPGYEDRKDKSGGDEYGDYIFWQQVIDHASSDKTDVVLVTDDNKADWWLKIGGDSVAPRPELIQEFRDVTGQNIIIWPSGRFYNHLIKETTGAGTPAEVQAAADDMQNAVMRAQRQKMREAEDHRNWIDQLNELAHSDLTLQPESPDGLTRFKTSEKFQKFLISRSRELMHDRAEQWPTRTPAERAIAAEVLDLIKQRNGLMRTIREIQNGMDDAPNSEIERALSRELSRLDDQLMRVDEQLSDAQIRRTQRRDDE